MVLAYIGLIFVFALSQRWQNCNYLRTNKATGRVGNFLNICKGEILFGTLECKQIYLCDRPFQILLDPYEKHEQLKLLLR